MKQRVQGHGLIAIGVVFIVSAFLVGFGLTLSATAPRPSGAPAGGTPALPVSEAPVYDSEPPNATDPAARCPLSTVNCQLTSLVLPDGREQPIALDLPIAAGDEVSDATGQLHVWRVRTVRYTVFPKYISRLIFVEELAAH